MNDRIDISLLQPRAPGFINIFCDRRLWRIGRGVLKGLTVNGQYEIIGKMQLPDITANLQLLSDKPVLYTLLRIVHCVGRMAPRNFLFTN